ncbi:MAG: putative capsular polysaccharide synthesis family protein [Cyclobacteriaceae bacterium]
MGKVGSHSIGNSLEKQYNGFVCKGHVFSKYFGELGQRKLFDNYYRKGKKKIKIISLVREPIGRNVSAFFQNFEVERGEAPDKDIYTIDNLRSIFLSEYRHYEPLSWFHFILHHFNIDVFKREFPSQGYCLYQNNEGVELLVLRSDLEDKYKEEHIGNFLDLSNFKIERFNIGRNKSYGEVYREFVEKVKLPEWYLEMMKESIFFNHFFSKTEIEEICSHWR